MPLISHQIVLCYQNTAENKNTETEVMFNKMQY